MIRLQHKILFFVIFLGVNLPAQQATRTINLEWEKIEKAVLYDLEISDPNRKPILSKTNADEKARLSLSPGEYLFRIRGKDKRGVSGPWSGYEKLSVKVGTVKLISPAKNWEKIVEEKDVFDVNFKWSQSAGAETYFLKVKSVSSAFEFKKEISVSDFTLPLPVGDTYNWSVQSKAQGQLSPASDGQFTLLGKNFARPTIKKPSSDFVRTISWSREKSSDSVDIFIWKVDPDSQVWKKIFEQVNVKETEFRFPHEWDGGQYRIDLLAKKDNKAISEKESLEFPVRFGDRSIASENRAIVETLFKRQSISGIFLNYTLSQINYRTQTPYLNSASQFAAITGTLSGGWERLFSQNYGVRTQASLGGMVINKKNNLLVRLEANGLYRQQISDISDSRFFGGLYYQEVPETHISLSGIKNEVSISKIYGLNLGVDYWRAIYGFWGAKTFVTYSLPLAGQSGFGPGLVSGSEISIGLAGSYRFEKNKIYSLGYRYKAEAYSFNSPNEKFEFNKIDLNGHYFNFDYSWEFE